MADNKDLRGERDRSRVDAGANYELRYIAKKHGVTIEQVREVISQVGNSREKIEEQLRRGRSDQGKP